MVFPFCQNTYFGDLVPWNLELLWSLDPEALAPDGVYFLGTFSADGNQ
jgi:hypothetical protein